MSALRNLPLLVDDPVARCSRRRPHLAPPRPREADIAMVGHRQSSIAAPNLRTPISLNRKRRRRPAAAAPPSRRQQVAQVNRHATGLPPLALARAKKVFLRWKDLLQPKSQIQSQSQTRVHCLRNAPAYHPHLASTCVGPTLPLLIACLSSISRSRDPVPLPAVD